VTVTAADEDLTWAQQREKRRKIASSATKKLEVLLREADTAGTIAAVVGALLDLQRLDQLASSTGGGGAGGGAVDPRTATDAEIAAELARRGVQTPPDAPEVAVVPAAGTATPVDASADACAAQPSPMGVASREGV
jgi:proteasome assembly chaperone (PAC2) family protein